jgi:hypothetical protein
MRPIARLLRLIGGLALLSLLFMPQAGPAQAAQPFPETGHTISDPFLSYWRANGGLAQFGYPISEVQTEISPLDGKLYTVQYFERAVFEYHPENAGTPYEVLLSQLGTYELKSRYPQGAPAGTPNPTTPRVFPETGHTLGGLFRAYWESHGGLAQQGYPLTGEFPEQNKLDGKTYTVQYFERAIFEYHPENAGTPYEVLLTQLGKYGLDSRYPNGTNPAAAPVAPPGTPGLPTPPPGQPPTAAIPPTATVPPTAVVPPTPTGVGTNCEPVAPERQSVIGHTGPVRISNVQPLGNEYVEIANDGPDAADLGGWTLRDRNEVEQHYRFAAGTTLAAGANLQVYTEPGHPYSFGSNRSVWNNCGDALELVDAGGQVVATYAYGTHCRTADCR